MKNMEIRRRLKESGVFQWQVAEVIGCSEGTFVRWLRRELPPEKKRCVLEAIDRILREA